MLRHSALPLLAVLLAACASDPGSPFGSPAEEDAPRSYLVRFEASCDTCNIDWSVGPSQGRVSDTALWSHAVRVTVFAGESLAAQLLVSPRPGEGPVSWARIRIDGEIVAEARGAPGPDRESALEGIVSVRTRVPPEGKREIATADPRR